MNYWLVKSDPEEYGWAELTKDGSTVWSGVRNYAARQHLNGMKIGDEVLFYHSGEDMTVVGITKVLKEAFKDPTTDDERWVAVELKAGKQFKNPVSLKEIKSEKKLKNIGLVRIGRLSVMQLAKDEFDLIVAMGN